MVGLVVAGFATHATWKVNGWPQNVCHTLCRLPARLKLYQPRHWPLQGWYRIQLVFQKPGNVSTPSSDNLTAPVFKGLKIKPRKKGADVLLL